ncbi:MAG: cytochrome c peroxidase [Chitinophagaceae bacterium]|nr:cytochrome c peroxidase [Chitinophagaceae bacterium]
MNRKYYGVLTAFFLLVLACSKKDQSAPAPKTIKFTQPSNFPQVVYNFSGNPLTEEGFELGKKLFYDGILSANGTVSCATCHIQKDGFAQKGQAVSTGINNQRTLRNSPAVQNMAFYPDFFWDGRVTHLDKQPEGPITNPVEMGEKLEQVVSKLKAHNEYPALFKKAFGEKEITSDLMSKALSQFMVMLVSGNSKYDRVLRKEGETFTNEEQMGYETFKLKCANCHAEPLFTDHSFRDIGLRPDIRDEGRYNVTGNAGDKNKFKVPGLRNAELTAPYMHNGSVISLFSVMVQYDQQTHNTANLDSSMKKNGQLGIRLNNEEKQNLVAFIKTLTDTSFISNKKFAKP